MAVRVELLVRDTSVTLVEGTVTYIPSDHVSIVILGATGMAIHLDGRHHSIQSSAAGQLLFIDLRRSTGFHRLQVLPGYEFWFATEDAKLRLDGIQDMLRYMRTEGLAWGGQILFSNGSVLRDPHVVFGWLDQHADPALRAAADIAAQPRRGRTTVQRVTRRGGKSLALRSTVALLRRRGKELLEEATEGPVEVDGKRYVPHAIVAKFRTDTLDTPANRRMVWLVSRLLELMGELPASGELPAHAATRVADWHQRAGQLFQAPVIHRLRTASRRPPAPARNIEEAIDPRYVSIYQVAAMLSHLVGWDPQINVRPLYAYVEFSDVIYQAFVALTVADALGLAPAEPTLGRVQPAFISANWELYYDTAPPTHVLRSWRSYTDQPQNYKPDVTLRSLQDGAVVLGDAKYRNSRQRASETSRQDLMLYMNAYDLEKAIIFYPPDPKEALAVHTVSAHGREIVEVTVSPVPGLRDFLHRELPPLLQRIKQHPAWHD